MIAGLCSDCRRGVHTHADTCGSQLDRPLSTCVCIVCPICNSTDVSVARNMKSTRHCDHCGHEWDPTPKPDGRLVPNAIAAVKIADVLDSLERRILERLGAGLGQWPIIEACNVVHDEFLRTRAAGAPMPVEMPPKQKNATVGPSSSICGAPTPRGPCTRPPGHFDLHIGANEPDAPPRPSHGDDMRALRIGPVPNTMAEVTSTAGVSEPRPSGVAPSRQAERPKQTERTDSLPYLWSCE